MSITARLNTAIEVSIEAGTITEEKQGAIIEAARKIARVMDHPEWPRIDGKVDNVTPSIFLKYCEKLGIAPDVGIEAAPKEEKNARLHIVGNSKWKRA